MANACRRFILKPPGLAEAEAARFAEKLGAAIEAQNRLARDTPHILTFTGGVQQTETAFYIEHESATSLAPGKIFDPAADMADEAQLIDVAAALFNALRVAHAGRKTGPIVHGGLCPGVLVLDENGIWKVTDFGFAQAVCDVFGVTSYVNLAIGPKAGGPPDKSASGAWEVLPADEYDRDDRICAFIDPEKYLAEMDRGEKALATFEAGSDIIAAGFILHLLAEHRHPYLAQMPDAHRVVDMTRMMAQGVATKARRKDLRESANAGIGVWCKAVEAMMAFVPRDRPSANDLAERLEPHATKIDFEEIQKRRDRVAAKAWLDNLEEALQNKQMKTLEALLDQRPELQHWPEDLSPRLSEIEEHLRKHRQEEKKREQIAADKQAAHAWMEGLRSTVKAKQWAQANKVLEEKPDLKYWPTDIAEEADKLGKRVHAAIKMLQDHQAAREWIERLASAVDAEDWDRCGELLSAKPDLEYWPKDVQKEVARCEALMESHIEATELDDRKARAWLAKVQKARKKSKYVEALRILEMRPQDIQHWPAEVLRAAEELEEECRANLADDIGDQLHGRSEAVATLAKKFVDEIVGSDLSDLLDPAIVRIRVMAEEFTSDAEFGEGRAQLVVSLGSVAGEAGGSEITAPFTFQVAAAPPRVLDEEKTTRGHIVEQFRRQLLQLQRKRLKNLATPLRKGIFPEAEITAKLDEPMARTTGEIRISGSGEPVGCIEVAIIWDTKHLDWALQDPEDLAKRATKIAVTAAQGAIDGVVFAKSEILRRYRASLTIPLTPVSPAGSQIPSPLEFNGQIVLHEPGSIREETLLTFVATSPKLGQLAIDTPLSTAESALQAFVIGRQNGSIGALTEDLTQRAKAADKKTKVKVDPKRVKKQPIDAIAIELIKKGAAPLKLAGTWNVETMSYDLPKAWENKVTQLIAPPPPKKVTEPPKKKDAQPKPKTKAETKAKAPPPSEKPPRKSAPPRPAKKKGRPDAPPATKAAAPEKPAAPKNKDPVRPKKKPRKGLILVSLLIVSVVATAGFVIFQNRSDQGNGNGPEPPPTVPTVPTVLTESTMPKIARLSIDNIEQQVAGTPFEVGLTAMDEAGNPLNVSEDTAFAIQAKAGLGELTGWLQGTISAGENSASIAQVSCEEPVEGLVIEAHTSGELPVRGESNAFDVVAPTPPVLPSVKLTNQELTEDRLKQTPPRDVWNVPLSELVRADDDLLSDAVRSVLREIDREAAIPSHDVKLARDQWKPDEQDGSTAVQNVRFTFDGLGIEFQARCSLAWDINAVTDADAWMSTWRVTNTESLAETAAWLAGAAHENVADLSDNGQLAEARRRTTQLASEFEALRESGRYENLEAFSPDIPPSWTPISGYSADEGTNADTGYPVELREVGTGRSMQLVHVYPKQSAIWNAINPPGGEGKWRIFYIDTQEWTETASDGSKLRFATSQTGDGQSCSIVESFNEAQDLAKSMGDGCRVPTNEEWMLAALALALYNHPTYSESGMLGGAWDWCADSGGGTPWVCGGCSLLGHPFDGRLTPPLPDAASVEQPGEALTDLWNWLNHPLVSQQRPHGDGLASFRTILPIYPVPEP